MFSLTRTLPTSRLTITTASRTFTTSVRFSKDLSVDEPSAKGINRDQSENINNKSKPASDNNDEHSAQASRGKQARENYKEGDRENADTRGDPGKMGKKAEEEFPEAPKPVIGMKEERGKVSIYT